MKKLLSITLAITTIAWFAGTLYVVPVAKAAVIDGDIVSADATFVDGDGNTYYSYDVFIVKIVGSKTFKRLVLNPQVFTSYGHLKWSNLKKISADTVKGYTTSSLTREINDTKVYKLIPDGDTGSKQWVEDLACFTSKGYDWDSVYIINATDRDNYTTGSSLCGGGGVEGAMTLSMASDTPGAATVPKNAYGITFMKINITGTGTISQMTFSRKGAGDVEDFDNVYLYENNVRLTTGRSISSATSKATFINLSIKAPTTIELVADLSATAGNQDYFSIESVSDVTANATVGGVFPLNGNALSMSGTDAGTLTVERTGSTAYNVDIGTTQAEISAFKLTANTEGALFKRLQVFNSGTVTNTLVTNLKLKDQDGNIVATASKIGDDGYATFVLSTPFSLAKGTSRIFRIYGDTGAQKPERTIIFYLELATDILATGTTFGYGMKATITNYTSGTAVTVTLKGGDLNLAKTGPGAKNIGTDTDDTVFVEFSMSAVADITIKKTRIAFCWDNGGEGTYDALTTTLGGGTDLEDVKMKDKDTGLIYAGPKDGSAIDTAVFTSGCPGDINGVYEDFDDTFDISAGETKTLQITADINTANTDVAGETDLVAGDKILFALYNWPQWIGDAGNISYMRYAGTTDAVDDSAISPSSNIAGDEMTIQAAALAVTLAASPSGTDATERKFALGQDGVDMAGFVFTSAEASDIKVTGLTLTGYVDEGDDDAFEPGLAGTNYVKDTIAGLELWEAESNTKIASTKGWSGTSYQDMVWSGISWTIPAGGSKTLLVKGNISSSGKATGDETDDTEELFIDIPDASADITAQDKDGNSVTATGDAVNGGETAGGCLAACNPGVNIS
ncbi:MAG: hypothetical protein OEW48_13590, partial [Phycisphaerae bacterium]|nr:hypothetical protein [Phycisphaerae bacterium]